MSDKKEFPTHYRYTDLMYQDGINLMLTEFYPIRETECFYFVVDKWSFDFLNRNGELPKYDKVRRIGKKARRSYCYPTKELAMKSYKARKYSQFNHCKASMERAELALFKLKDVESSDGNLNMGKTKSYENYIFD